MINFHQREQWMMLVMVILLCAAIKEAESKFNPLECTDDHEQHWCGNVSIPYPFATTINCSMSYEFVITCNTSYVPPLLFYYEIPVLDISLSDGELRVSNWVASDCNTPEGNRDVDNSSDVTLELFGDYSKLSVSSTRNKFTAIGCDTAAYISDYNVERFSSGCVSICYGENSIGSRGDCSGMGCCQTVIPDGLKDYRLSFSSFNNHTKVWNFSPCSYGFVVQEDAFEFDPKYIGKFPETSVPMVLEWVIDNVTCEEAMKMPPETYACKNNSYCYHSQTGDGYRCNCLHGFTGNPYSPGGCHDVDECLAGRHNCDQICTNTIGSYNCSCLKGFHQEDGQETDVVKCVSAKKDKFPIAKFAAGVGIIVLVLLVGCCFLLWGIKKRNQMRLKHKYFQENGGVRLQQLSKGENSFETTKIFGIDDLNRATNSFHESNIVGRGGFGTVYKGVLSNAKIVAIKKSTVSDQSQIEQFINEVIILSQINHRNVVKLLGCCLDTQVPLLVYEFITNDTLHHHLHETISGLGRITWVVRLRIAKETATALAYLHSAASTPIIHRDVKSTNILLDENFTAKVSDFGASKLVPLDKTQLTTMVQGTLGYLDPEYFHTSKLTEKSDVYSFGVVLAELITGRTALSFARPEGERNLATYFIWSMEENRLLQILDPRLEVEADNIAEEVIVVANLARTCLSLNGDERPTMKEVAMELEGLAKHHWVGVDLYPEETQQLLVNSSEFGGSVYGNAYDHSVNNPIIPVLQSNDGR